MHEFRNPYNFIAFDVEQCKGKIEASKAALNQHEIGHDQWHSHKFTGKINFTLDTLTHLALGNQHKESNGLTYILPYFNKGRAAIPGNSVRGMVSSLAEIISQSPPRVLADQLMSVRQKSIAYDVAYGVVVTNERNQLVIQPLGLADLTLPKGPAKKLPTKWQQVFVNKNKQPLPLSNILAIRLAKGDKSHQALFKKNTNNEWRCQQFQQTSIDHDPMFADKYLGDTLAQVPNKTPWLEPVMAKKKHIKKHIADRLLRRAEQGSHTIQTIVRTSAKGNNIAFDAQGAAAQSPVLPISDDVFQKYQQNFITSNEAQSKAHKTNSAAIKQQLLGNIVLFDINSNSQVTEIKPSVLWRETLAHSVHQFLTPEARPFQGQRQLSPVEQMFGFIDKDNTNEETLRAYASRLKFSDLVCNTAFASYQQDQGDEKSHYYVMPLMDKPKLPCPTMYFHNKHNTWQNKQAINPEHSEPNGRKVYLRHMRPDIQPEKFSPFKQAEYSNRSLIKLIAPLPTAQFSGSIEFENFTLAELELLVRALHPSSQFIHQLGYGKPFGYGQMRVSASTLTVDKPEQDYQLNALFSPKPRQTMCLQKDFNAWLGQQQSQQQSHHQPTNKSLIHEHSLALLSTLGSYNEAWGDWQITYPKAKKFGGENTETGFQWFVHNEFGNKTRGRNGNKKYQTLSRLTLEGIEPLKRNDLDNDLL